MSSPLILSPRLLHDDSSRLSFSKNIDISYIVDSLTTMRKQEDYYVNKTATDADEHIRRKMCMWCFQLVDHYNFSRNTVAIAMSYFDRYSCTKEGQNSMSNNNRKSYQLSVMTTLYMAIKLHEPIALGLSAMKQISKGLFTEGDFTKKECEILNALQWRLSEPTPLDFVRHFMALLPDSVDQTTANFIEDYARYQTELAAMEYRFVTVRPSYVAYASLLNALATVSKTSPLSPYTKGLFIRSVEQFCNGMITENAKQLQPTLSLLLLKVAANTTKEAQQKQVHDSGTMHQSKKLDDPQKSSCSVRRSSHTMYSIKPRARRLYASAA